MHFGIDIFEIVIIYLFLSFFLTVFKLTKMRIVNYKANDVKKGKKRRKELIKKGKWRQLPLYSLEEIAENRKLNSARITIFKTNKEKNAPCAIILPGGGYGYSKIKQEGYPVAAYLNDKGINAIVLEYRTGRNCSSHAPMVDLAKTVEYMFSHQKKLEIHADNYALIGFSTGGNIAGMFGTEKFGYKHYGVEKPASIILGYPWTNVNHFFDHPYWNIWDGLISLWFSERGNIHMFGPIPTRKQRESLCIQKWMNKNFPPTYMFTGDEDFLVHAGSHTSVIEKALKQNNIPYKYQQFYNVPHGVGLGIGTNSEGWLDEAIDYWLNRN